MSIKEEWNSIMNIFFQNKTYDYFQNGHEDCYGQVWASDSPLDS